MKKFFYFVCIIASLLVFHSCSNDISEDLISSKKIKLTQNEVLSISYDETKDLDEKTLFDMVSSFAELQAGATTRNNATSFKTIKKSFINKEGEFIEHKQATRAINNNGITSKICEIEFKNGSSIGRAIVSANANYPSIIAFLPQCNSDKMIEKTGATELLHASKASYLYKTLKMKELVDSLRLPTLEKISKELELPINEVSYEKVKNHIAVTDAEPSTRSTPVQIGDIKVQIHLGTSIFPLVKTNWGQEYPYNGWFSTADVKDIVDWVRTENGGKDFTSVPVGCVNIAMAQMMTYTHQRRIPQTEFPIPKQKGSIGMNGTFMPNWSQMIKTPKLDDPGAGGLIDAQRLIVDLYIENSTKSKKDYDGAVTSSEVTETNMLKTMSKYFKYKPKASFNGDLALAALKNKNLVLMLTSNHVFIISGMLFTDMKSTTRELVKFNDLYWHANLGWANECTGFYQLDSNANTYFDIEGIKEWAHKMDYLNNISAN